MKRVQPDDRWPESWKLSYSYDLEEVYGEIRNYGYAYAYENRRKHTLRLLSEAVPPPARVLDIAAGQGNFSLALAEMGYDVTWNDLRGELADYVRLKHEFGRLEYRPGNASELEFRMQFDAVLLTEVIEHVAHPDRFLVNAARLVRPGGFLVLTTPNGAYFRNTLPKFSDCPDPSVFESVQFRPNADGHIFLLHPEELATLTAQAGLTLEKLVLFTTPLTNGHLRLSSLLPVLPKAVVRGAESFVQLVPIPALFKERIMVQLGARLQKA